MHSRKRKMETTLVDDELSSLSDQELREQLKAVGEDAGPMDSSTRPMYIRLLSRKKFKQATGVSGSSSLCVSPAQIVVSDKPGPRGLVTPPVATRAQIEGSTPLRGGQNKRAVRITPEAKTEKKAIRNFHIEGLTAAVFTPFNNDKSKGLNLSMIEAYADQLLVSGVKNLFLGGSAGESLSLTVQERKSLAEEWIRVGAGRFKIIVHIGTENLKDTCELARHAHAVKAAAIGVMPMTFFKISTIDILVQYLAEVGEAAPSLPMYYYHIPSMTGVDFSMEEFLAESSSHLPTLRGIKFSSPNLLDFGRCVITQNCKYQIVYGADEQVIGALALGGMAAIGSTYNYAGKLNNRLFTAYLTKDTEGAMLEQRRSQALVKVVYKYGGHPGVGKAIMKLCGLDCGPPRLPFLSLTSNQAKCLESDLDNIGFFQWA